MSDNRPARYVEEQADGTVKVVYRASSLGGCDRKMVAHARKYTPRPHPQWFQEVLDEGTNAEQAIREMASQVLEDRDCIWEDQAELELEVAEIDGDLIVVRAHADDLMLDGERGYLLREYKKFRASTWPAFQRQGVEVHENYPWQVAAMMHALLARGEDVLCQFIGGHMVDGEIVEVECKLLLEPPIPLKAIVKKLAKVERMIRDGLDPSEVPCSGGFPCPFWYLHDEQPEKVEVVLDTAGDEVKAAWEEWHRQKMILQTAEEMTRNAKAIQEKAAEVLRKAAGDAQVLRMGDQVLTRVVREVPEQQITRKGYTSDYFQLPRAGKKEKDS